MNRLVKRRSIREFSCDHVSCCRSRRLSHIQSVVGFILILSKDHSYVFRITWFLFSDSWQRLIKLFVRPLIFISLLQLIRIIAFSRILQIMSFVTSSCRFLGHFTYSSLYPLFTTFSWFYRGKLWVSLAIYSYALAYDLI